MLNLLLVAGGGAVGAVLRYAIAFLWIPHRSDGFPLGTLAVNVIGCLLLGFGVAMFAGQQIRDEYRLLLFTGLLGAFTTFSTYGLETISLSQGGAMKLAVVNVVLSNVLGLAGVLVGLRAGQVVFGGA